MGVTCAPAKRRRRGRITGLDVQAGIEFLAAEAPFYGHQLLNVMMALVSSFVLDQDEFANRRSPLQCSPNIY